LEYLPSYRPENAVPTRNTSALFVAVRHKKIFSKK
jgi:hypothetical protein